MADLTLAEKAAKWDELDGKKTVRKGKSKARRIATQTLIKAHQGEYDGLVKASA